MIISCGESLIDFVPQTTANLTYAPCHGGSPYNLAIAAARLGTPVGFLGNMSQDFFGDMLFDRLKTEGVRTDFIRRLERPTTLAFVKIDQDNEPRYAFFTENSADRNLLASDLPPRLPDEVQCLVFGSISLLLPPQADTIKELVKRESAHRTISFDPNVRPMLIDDKSAYVAAMEKLASLAAIVKVSAADMEWMYTGQPVLECAKKWLESGPRVVVITRGKDGAVLLTERFTVEVPKYFVEVKDTIGAGDTFHAAFLTRLFQMGRLAKQPKCQLSQDEAKDALEFAVKASSLNCARQGADPPTVRDMEAAK